MRMASPPAAVNLVFNGRQMKKTKWESLRVDDAEVPPGFKGYISLPIARMLTGGQTALPLHCARGLSSGPTLSVLASVHGDEPQPIRALRNVLEKIKPDSLRGTLLAIPVANPFAFLQHVPAEAEKGQADGRPSQGRHGPEHGEGSHKGREMAGPDQLNRNRFVKM